MKAISMGSIWYLEGCYTLSFETGFLSEPGTHQIG